MFKGINAIDFNKHFRSDDDCFEYLLQLKWLDGFRYSRCSSIHAIKGRTWQHRRCQKCRYDENVLANTVFHGVKKPLLKAFYMLFRLTDQKLTDQKKRVSTVELGHEVGVQQKTAWLFKRKVQHMMKEEGMTK